MTREELIDLLKLFKATYPKTKPITDPESTLAAWELALGDEDTGKVYKAARVYIKTKGNFFPSPKDIYELIGKGQLVYEALPETTLKLESHNDKDFVCPGSCVCPYYDFSCKGTKEEFDKCEL